MKALFLKGALMALLLTIYFNAHVSNAQANEVKITSFNNGYVMVDNEMLVLNQGKMTKMMKTQRMENGTKIKKNGVVKVKGQKRMKMKNGHCIDHSGKVEDCNVASQPYSCAHHKHIRSHKAGKCPECGMDLVKRK